MSATAQLHYNKTVAITKSDTVNIVMPSGKIVTDAIYVGVTGDIAFVGQNDEAQTFIGAIAGTIVPIGAKRVNSANTTAASLLALFEV